MQVLVDDINQGYQTLQNQQIKSVAGVEVGVYAECALHPDEDWAPPEPLQPLR
jgi:hypothetical protein